MLQDSYLYLQSVFTKKKFYSLTIYTCVKILHKVNSPTEHTTRLISCKIQIVSYSLCILFSILVSVKVVPEQHCRHRPKFYYKISNYLNPLQVFQFFDFQCFEFYNIHNIIPKIHNNVHFLKLLFYIQFRKELIISG